MSSRGSWTVCVAVVVLVSGLGIRGVTIGPGPASDPPYIATNASAAPSPIWVSTSPPGRVPREATVTLVLDGRGVPVAEFRSQDVVFMIDASTSMRQNDPLELRLAAAKHYVDLLNTTDRAAVVEFNQNAFLVRGDHLSSDFARVKANIDMIPANGFTNLYDPIRIATDELVSRGNGTHVWVEIMLTDGEDTTGHTDAQILTQAQRAADSGITIFTVGLIGSGRVNEELLRQIASLTGGEYLRAQSANDLQGIYERISHLVRYPDLAGRDNTVAAVLPSYIGYVPGTAVPTPDYVGTSGGQTLVEWNFTKLKINETWTATFRITSSQVGTHLYALVYAATHLDYTRYDEQRVTVAFPETFVDVLGTRPPVADAGGPYAGAEGSPVTFSAIGSSDPDGDPLTFRWDFQSDGTWDTGWTPIPTAAHTWGDDWSGVARLEVSDGNMTSNATASVIVRNVAPGILDVHPYVLANLTLRVAGEKWHDVRMDLQWNGGVTATARVVRYPGSPDRQSGTIEGGRLELLGSFAIVLYYTPADDPVNGRPNGANPVWVILAMPDGSEVRLHHTFNVRHPSTWTWTLTDLRPFFVGQRITFDAAANDVGSDDLTFAWSFGDGSPDVATIHFNNGVSPDPYPSPDVNPITVSATRTHAFSTIGVFTVTLVVRDDDGGTVTTSIAIALP